MEQINTPVFGDKLFLMHAHYLSAHFPAQTISFPTLCIKDSLQLPIIFSPPYSKIQCGHFSLARQLIVWTMAFNSPYGRTEPFRSGCRQNQF
jgi:hypothetical protein